MKLTRPLLIAAASSLIGSPAAAAAPAQDCGALASLIRLARSDFPSLRQKRLEPGKCVFRDSEYKCEWQFPGDAFADSDVQAKRLTQCVAATPTAQPVKAKSNDTVYAIDPDLIVEVGAPRLDDDGWKVRLRVITTFKPL